MEPWSHNRNKKLCSAKNYRAMTFWLLFRSSDIGKTSIFSDKVNRYTFKGSNSSFSFYVPSQSGQLLRKEFAP